MALPLKIPRGLSDPTLVIAELSANHGGSLETALATVRAAVEAGADAIKLQTYTADTLTIDCDRPEFRIEGGPWGGQTLHALYQQAFTPWEWHAPLQELATELGLPLFSTPFDTTAIEYLEDLGVPAHKVASFELIDHGLLRAVAATGKPMIVSTGMADGAEIEEAVVVIREQWGERDPGLVLLHCISAYPAPAEEMNLAAVPELARRFGCLSGLSDHSLGNTASVGAVLLGARVLERHFILDRSAGGPDSHFSLEPAQFKGLVDEVRVAEQAVGTSELGTADSEKASRLFRRSLFVVRDVAAGARIAPEDVRSIRPGHGLAPKYLNEVVGRTAKAAIERGTPVSWELLA